MKPTCNRKNIIILIEFTFISTLVELMFILYISISLFANVLTFTDDVSYIGVQFAEAIGYRLGATVNDGTRPPDCPRGDVCIDVRQIYRLPREPSRSFVRCHYTHHVFRIGSLDVASSRSVIYQGVAAVIGSLSNKTPVPIVSTGVAVFTRDSATDR